MVVVEVGGLRSALLLSEWFFLPCVMDSLLGNDGVGFDIEIFLLGGVGMMGW